MPSLNRGGRARRIASTAAGALAAGLLAWSAAAPPAASQAPAAQPAYHPSLGDLMTMAVQPRHTKLGLAGRARNWAYAGYEASELRNAFNRIARTIPTYRDEDLAGQFASNAKDPLDRIDRAIKARNGPAFDAAYAEITKACNACHRGFDHAFVVIRAPAAADFPDQSFVAPPPAAPRR